MIAASGQNYQLCIFTGFILKLYNLDMWTPPQKSIPKQWFLDAISTTGKVVSSNMEYFLEKFQHLCNLFIHSQIFSEI